MIFLKRLDQILVEQGLAASRTQAQKMITAGQVSVLQGGVATVHLKASSKFLESIQLQVEQGEEQRYVSRAGLKLEAILRNLSINVAGITALDVGQSTGGFTDCLIQQGVARVVGVDVGHDQLAAQLRNDARVFCIEGLNARNINQDVFRARELPEQYALVVMDVSFISQTLIVPELIPLLEDNGMLISLVKPQFEVGKDGIGKGGIVKSDSWYPKVEALITQCFQQNALEIIEYCESPIKGGDGNREFFVVAKHATAKT